MCAGGKLWEVTSSTLCCRDGEVPRRSRVQSHFTQPRRANTSDTLAATRPIRLRSLTQEERPYPRRHTKQHEETHERSCPFRVLSCVFVDKVFLARCPELTLVKRRSAGARLRIKAVPPRLCG